MENLVIKAEPRTTVRKGLKALRREGLLPGVLYGGGKPIAVVQMPAHETTYALRHVTGSTLIDLDVVGKVHKVLVREIQRHPTRDYFIHIDFQEVDMKKTVHATLDLNFVGEAHLVSGARLSTLITHIEVEALPGDLVDTIDVDLSQMADIGDQIFIRDLPVPKGMTILTSGDDLVAQVVALAIAAPEDSEVEAGEESVETEETSEV